MRNKIISVLLATLIVLSVNGCNPSVIVDAETTQEQAVMFEQHKLDDCYSIFVDKETGVCYLVVSKDKWENGITVMLNADGTPKIWEEN